MERVTARDVYAATGFVSWGAALASNALTQFGATLAGNYIVSVLLDDDTLGRQAASVRKLLERAGSDPLEGYPANEREVRDLALDVVRSIERLVPLRNRVAHDYWSPAGSDEAPDLVVGRQAKVFGRPPIRTTCGTLNFLGNLLGDAGGLLFNLEERLTGLRGGLGGTRELESRLSITMLRERKDTLVARLSSALGGSDARWQWHDS